MKALFREGLDDDALRCGVHARIGNDIQPLPQLGVKIIKVAKRARQEEVFTNIAEWSLDLSLRLGAIWFAGLWMKAEMASEIEQSAVINNAARFAFADDRSLHSVVKDLARNAADRIERRRLASQHRRQILMHSKSRPDETAIAQHHRKQPDDPGGCRLIGEDDMELGEILLGLFAGSCFEPNFKPGF